MAQPPYAVEIRRSTRRKRSVGAQLKGGTLVVTVPAWMSAADSQQWADRMAQRFARRAVAEEVDLPARARALARRYDLPEPATVRWVEMDTRWGSCTPSSRSIRVASKMAGFPPWVLDYVLVHELAHLVEANHSDRFWALVHRYPLTERARGYLIARAGDTDLDEGEAPGEEIA